MGRTTPTSTQLIQQFEADWRAYARGLRKQDQDRLQQLYALARAQSAAISQAMAADPASTDESAYCDPFEAFMLSMLLGLLKEIDRLKAELAARDDIIEVEAPPSPSDG